MGQVTDSAAWVSLHKTASLRFVYVTPSIEGFRRLHIYPSANLGGRILGYMCNKVFVLDTYSTINMVDVKAITHSYQCRLRGYHTILIMTACF